MAVSKFQSRGAGKNRYEDGVVVHGTHDERWQKHGHDRIYPEVAEEGYVDLNAGEVVDMEPHYDSGVSEFRLDFNPEKDALELVAVPREGARRQGAEEGIIATIPTEVLG